MASSGSSGYNAADSNPAAAPHASQADSVTGEVVQRVEEATQTAQGSGSMDVDTANGEDTQQREHELSDEDEEGNRGNGGDAAASTWVFIRELQASAAREGRNFAVFGPGGGQGMLIGQGGGGQITMQQALRNWISMIDEMPEPAVMPKSKAAPKPKSKPAAQRPGKNRRGGGRR